MPDRTRPHVLGVDGSKGGWVGVAWNGAAARPLFASHLAALCDEAEALTGAGMFVVAVDTPIGLSGAGHRAGDDEVRALIGARRSSLFTAPARGLLTFEDDQYAAANAWSKEHLGHGLSKQAWMLMPKIRDARSFAATGSRVVVESFPELSYFAMNGNQPLSHPKRSWTGMATRLRLLHDQGIVLPVDAGPAGAAAADDLLDAAAMAWSAMRIHQRQSQRLPAAASAKTRIPGDLNAHDSDPSIHW